MTTESVLFDAVYIPGGKTSVDILLKNAKYIKLSMKLLTEVVNGLVDLMND